MRLKILLGSMFIFLVLVTIAEAGSVGISTGSKTGTYIMIGKDLKKVCSPYLSLKVYPSEGSLQNYARIIHDERIKFAIIQADVLLLEKYLASENSRKNGDVNKVKMVYPLYNEEIHVVVMDRGGIENFSQLDGKKVVVGTKGSGTWVTSALLQELTGVKFREIYTDSKNGLKKLLRGEVDAVIMVAGTPTKLLSVLPEDAPIRILSLRNDKIESFYIPTVIRANTYPFQENDVKTYAVKSILVTYDYKEYQPSYNSVRKLAECIVEKLPYLKKYGHPKWKEVNPESIKEVDWLEVHPAVKDYFIEKKAIEKTIERINSLD